MIREAYKDFTDSIDQVHPAKNPPVGRSQNGVRWTSEYMILLKRYEECTEEDISRYKAMVDKCMVEPGLLSRFPGSGEQEGPDNYYSLLGACVYLGITRLPREILEYGQKNNFIYNNINPGKFTGSAFMGRQLPLVACMYYASGKEPNAILKAALVVSLLLSANSSGMENQDAKALGYFQLLVVQGRSSFWDKIISYWFKKLHEEFPGGMKDVLKKYFNYDEFPTTFLWKE